MSRGTFLSGRAAGVAKIDPGTVFGWWTVLGPAPSNRYGRVCLCRCACGKEKTVLALSLRAKTSTRCGICGRRARDDCYRPEDVETYKSWRSMHARCTSNPTNYHYKYYTGRGIAICARWGSFKNFLSDMGPRPSSRHSVEREDVNGNYEPDNCKWATPVEQARNRRNTKRVTFRGELVPLAEAVEALDIRYSTVLAAMRRGHEFPRACEIALAASGRAMPVQEF